MKIEELLQKTQTIAYQTIKNGFLKDQISHAYLFSGAKGTPLKETALFLAQSLICEKPTPLACDECLSCIRLKNGSYVDFQFINQEEGNITKDMIESLQADFALTALEEKGRKVYIIHLIEKANPTAVNRLLKFLEEPAEDVFAILTTENITKVLPTIISRCQIIRLKGRDKKQLVKELLSLNLEQSDAYILASFNNSKEEVEELLKETNYNEIKDLAWATFKTLFTEPLSIHYYVQQEIVPSLRAREDYALYLNILEIYLKELLFGRLKEFLGLDFTMNPLAEKIIKVDEAVKQVMLASGKLTYNVNPPLLLDELFYQIALKGGLI